MPRPRKNPDEVLKRELRITPPNGVPISDWSLDASILKFVAFEEGGNDSGKKLHYHCYIETTMTSQALPKWVYTVAGCIESGEKGNAVFFSRAPHEATMGYIAKGRKLSKAHNFENHIIDEWFTQSDEYRKQREATRKREQRSRTDELKTVIEYVKKELTTRYLERNVESVISLILDTCHQREIVFPTRSQMEKLVVELLYPYDSRSILEYYTRSFPKFFS